MTRADSNTPEASVTPAGIAASLASLVDRFDDAVLLLDSNWCITFANPVARLISHIADANIGRETLWELYPEIVGTELERVYRHCVANQVTGTVGDFYYAPFETWFHIRIFPLDGGAAVHYRNVTAQKGSETSLRESETRYRVLTELSPQSLWTASPEGLVLYANQRFLEYIGKEFVPRTGTEYVECFAMEDRERVVEVWTHSVTTGEEYAIDARLIRASDSEARWWHLRALPLRDDSGNIQQWLGSAIDIHEDRMAADRLADQYRNLERQRRELEAIYNGSPIGMALYEPKDLRLLRLNQRQSEIFSIRPDDAIGKTIFELVPGETVPHQLMRRASLGEPMLNQPIHREVPGKPSESRHFEVNYSPVFGEDGSVQAVAGASFEVTHQKLAEQALLQAEKLAAVGRMASSIAHEINNPLESVTNLLFLARNSTADPEAQQFLDLADQELRRVSSIANQTLRFHKQASNPRKITATDLFSTVLSLYEGRLRNSNIRVDTSRLGGSPVACFEGDIRQVLNNLVGNAVDAMPNGGTLTLRARDATEQQTARPGLLLSIADSGVGMSPETQARIFEAFFTTKGISGTGLGLWISSGIMERHSGRLRLRSCCAEANHGTVFTLFLPFESSLMNTSEAKPGPMA